ncbi:hypothetical protein [Nonomuraea sediminis]|uniref:hypothetical protein n=1 Tax=Nonomuraea sediminis TaxID=2835864 RepID=UPI001BDCFECE|nr:hypothetical protein [Nonomuraea sediminis]
MTSAVQRDDLSPLEEAQAIKDMIAEEDITQKATGMVLRQALREYEQFYNRHRAHQALAPSRI